MPQIAPGAHLTAIAAQLNVGTPAAGRELRAQANNLYVKAGAGIVTKLASRTAHQAAAVALLRGGLQQEYGLTQGQATTVMTNVFHGAPTQVTVGQMNTLNQFAQQTNHLMNGQTTRPEAFDLAGRIEAAMLAGTPAAQADARGVAASHLLAPGTGVQLAWDLGERVRALEAGGVPPADARAQGRIAAGLIAQAPALPHQTAMAVAAQVHAAEQQGANPATARAQGLAAVGLVTAHNATPAQAFGLAVQIDAAVAGGALRPTALAQAQTACAVLAGAPGGTTAATAFAQAGLVEAAVAGGAVALPAALLQAQTACAALAGAGAGATHAQAFTMAGLAEAAIATGKGRAEMTQQAQTACGVLAASPAATPAHAFALAEGVEANIASGATRPAAMQRAATACALLALVPAITPRQAFGVAGRAEAAITGGLGRPEAMQQAQTACTMFASAPKVTSTHAFDVAAAVEADVLNGTPRGTASLQGQTACALLANAASAGGAVPTAVQAYATAGPMAVRAGIAIAGGMAVPTAVSHAAGACVLAAGGIAAPAAFSLGACAGGMIAGRAPEAAVLRLAQAAAPLLAAAPDGKAAMLQALRAEAAALPVWDAANAVALAPAAQGRWLELGKCCGAPDGLTQVDRQAIPLGQRASMLTAMSREAHAQIQLNPANAKHQLVAVSQVARSCTVADLTPASEGLRMTAFHAAVAGSAQIQTARGTWAGLTHEQRILVVREIMRLHAHHLGYTAQAPQLTRANLDPGTLGLYSPVDNRLTIDTAKPAFASFPRMFNVVVHESTHAYQRYLTDEYALGNVGVADDRHDQARIFSTADAAPLTIDMLRLAGIRGGENHTAYRTSPIEQHAFHYGDAAQAAVTP